MQLTITQITELTQALTIVSARNPNFVVQKLSWDTRQFQQGMLFVALRGERLDGNDFIVEAIEKGAAVVIASRQVSEAERRAARQNGAALLLVVDGTKALQKLALEYRKTLHAKVIGITGSSGKTSTRQFVSAVVETAFITVVSLGNRNNEIGLPATVLEASPTCDVLVLEMAMRGLGQIAELCEIARPQIGIITNIGTAHMELLGSRENIAQAKSELIQALPDGTGIAILNGDDSYTALIQEHAQTRKRKIRIVSFGLEHTNDIHAERIVYNELGQPTFDLVMANKKAGRVGIGIAGRHSIYNALAAAAAGFCLGIDAQRIISALEQVESAPMRQVSHTLSDGSQLIDDTYNANPDSMRAALEVLTQHDAAHLHIAVLGDMGELGPEAAQLHQEVGAFAHTGGTDVLITVGELAHNYALGAKQAGMDTSKIVRCQDITEAFKALAAFRAQRPTILIKGSRFMGLERLVQMLLESQDSSVLPSHSTDYTGTDTL